MNCAHCDENEAEFKRTADAPDGYCLECLRDHGMVGEDLVDLISVG